MGKFKAVFFFFKLSSILFCTCSMLSLCAAWEDVLSKVCSIAVHPHTHVHTKRNVDSDHLKKDWLWICNFLGIVKMLFLQGQLWALFCLRSATSLCTKTWKCKGCQVLPERKSAVSNPWCALNLPPQHADGAGWAGSVNPARSIRCNLEFTASWPWVSFDLKYS